MKALSSLLQMLREISLSQQLIVSAGILFCVGIIMIGSASMGIASANNGSEFFFIKRHASWLVLGFLVALIILRVPIDFWERHSKVLFLLGIFVLILVLIPGIGKKVNGSMRWIPLGFINAQPSEAAKLALVIYMSSFLVRYQESIRTGTRALILSFFVLAVVAVLLLAEPDFGATMVAAITVMGMIFLAGVSTKRYIVSVTIMAVLGVAVVMMEGYRLRRLKTFLDPWKEKFDEGYQLTQSLIAFGRGDWFGVGLGKSVQKMFYLPEAHTDFVFAIYAEEFGLFGIFFLLAVFALLVHTIMTIGRQAERKEKLFAAYLSYGIALLILTQVTVNICVNMGLLPTKGLTLPLISYGGSSMMVTFVMLAILLRIDRENSAPALAKSGARS